MPVRETSQNLCQLILVDTAKLCELLSALGPFKQMIGDLALQRNTDEGRANTLQHVTCQNRNSGDITHAICIVYHQVAGMRQKRT